MTDYYLQMMDQGYQINPKAVYFIEVRPAPLRFRPMRRPRRLWASAAIQAGWSFKGLVWCAGATAYFVAALRMHVSCEHMVQCEAGHSRSAWTGRLVLDCRRHAAQ